MNALFTRSPVPTWRIVAYAFAAAMAVAALGIYEHDRRLYVAAIISGIVVGCFGFLLNWMTVHVTVVPSKNTSSEVNDRNSDQEVET